MTNRVKTDTGAARLPALPKVNLQDKALANWVNAVTERMQVREGERGNDNERTVTLRELRAITGDVENITKILTEEKTPGDGEVVVSLGGGLTATVQVERFAQSIINSRLFQDLAKTLDDPSRFDFLAKEIRDELLRSITDEAAKRGAEIRDVELLVQSNERSFAMAIREVTASLMDASAGIRASMAAFSDGQRAMATNVLQLQASLGNYYQDGSPGRASLQQEMTVLADYAEGLRAQYTLKVQAGGALAGYGIAAEEVNGKTSSAFIIMADKFAIVGPNYSGGLLQTPRAQDVVFGVDANGIYLQNNVYVKGNLRVDGTGKTLSAGLRGSLMLAASGSSWSDATARQAVWQALGNFGSAPNNLHLVAGDSVTISNGAGFVQTRHWMGSAWLVPAAVFNGGLLVRGSVAADAVDTRGLTVRDAFGNIILSANGLDAQWLRNLKAAQVDGLGALALRDRATIGATVAFPDGTVMNTSDFINRLTRITTNNIHQFMDTAAIGTAYIGQAAIGTLQVAGGAITSMGFGEGGAMSLPGSSSRAGAASWIALPSNASGVVVVGMAEAMPLSSEGTLAVYLRRNGVRFAYANISLRGSYTGQCMVIGFDRPSLEGSYMYDIEVVNPSSGPGSGVAFSVSRTAIIVSGGKR